jgi:very-short-patch-repair endonuclease
MRATLAKVREDLLDLGLRNPLLNYRLLKTRGLEVQGAPPATLYYALVGEKLELSFYSPDVALLFATDASSEDAADPLTHLCRTKTLPTPHAAEELNKRLLATMYSAKSSIEEQGVNTLFLALGKLEWRDPEDQEVPRYAPLILVPVEINRENARSGFKLKYNDEDVIPNISLVRFLFQSFGVEIKEFTEEDDLDVAAYFATVAEEVSNQDGWSVHEDFAAVGFFSFSKFLMYRDLDSETWTNDAEILNHEILNCLLGSSGFSDGPSPFGNSDFVDDHHVEFPPSHVLDADSSQSLAILDVASGRSMVCQGPPGTGKSQSIVNIIAGAIGDNKTVLFVSEKKAALDVVKSRIDKLGLGPLCLELHSNKVKKKEVIAELKRTYALQVRGDVNSASYEAELETARIKLNEYADAVNSFPGNSHESVHDLYGCFLPVRERFQGIDVPDLTLNGALAWSTADVQRLTAAATLLQERITAIGVPNEHLFWGTKIRAILPATEESIRQVLSRAQEGAHALSSAAERLGQLFSLAPPKTREELILFCATGKHLTEAPVLGNIDLENPLWASKESAIRKGIDLIAELQALHSEWREKIRPAAWSADVEALEASSKLLGAKWWHWFSPAWRQLKHDVAELASGPPPQSARDVAAILKAIRTAAQDRDQCKSLTPLLSSLFGEFWTGDTSDTKLLARQLDWIAESHRGVLAGQLHHACLSHANHPSDQQAVTDVIAEAETLLTSLTSLPLRIDVVLKLDPAIKESKLGRLLKEGWNEGAAAEWAGLLANVNSLEGLVAYLQARDELESEGMSELAALADHWVEGAGHLVDLFQYRRISVLLEAAFAAHPILASFSPLQHTERVNTFRRLDVQKLASTCNSIAAKHVSAMPGGGASNGQVGVLKREFEKRARHLPVRKLILQSGNAIQALKPVFLMSPLSVANFLAPGTITFDLVIFDEASQVRPADALGAIVRGRQTVVVGDSSQLPPTSFFDSLIVQDDESEEDDAPATADIESILGLFCARGAHQRRLLWHYRSKHESLIVGSNHLFYDDQLIVFPSPDKDRENVGLCYRPVPGIYDRGRSRTNREEAKAVAAAVMEHARAQVCKPENEWLTLGVAALSNAQRDAILAQLEILRRQEPDSETFFGAPPHELFFVKSLEAVQGDERDVIFVSIGYGPTAEGYMTMGFGPVTHAGGERRLNVLFSRARRRCEVFASFHAEDITLDGRTSGGLHALKTFLNLAEHGIIDVAVQTGRPPDSPFEEQVFKALQLQAYTVHTQVGSAGFFLDLAIVDPGHPGRYLIGIECDGRAYHSARSSRDRDRLRQHVLESLGWTIHRIWSTAWFRSPERELATLKAAIEKAQGGGERPNATSRSVDAATVAAPYQVATEQDSPEPETTTPTYTFADLSRHEINSELHRIQTFQLAKYLAEVVATESPVHWMDAVRRIASVAGVTRIGDRIRGAFFRACKLGNKWKLFVFRDYFLWADETLNVTVRNRSNFPAAMKKLELVAPEEICAAIEMAVTNSFGLERQDVPVSVCRLLGFSRTTDNFWTIIDPICEQMLRDERLVLRGTTVTVKNGTDRSRRGA